LILSESICTGDDFEDFLGDGILADAGAVSAAENNLSRLWWDAEAVNDLPAGVCGSMPV